MMLLNPNVSTRVTLKLCPTNQFLIFISTLMVSFCAGPMFATQRLILFNALSKCVNRFNVTSRMGNNLLTVSVKCKQDIWFFFIKNEKLIGRNNLNGM